MVANKGEQSEGGKSVYLGGAKTLPSATFLAKRRRAGLTGVRTAIAVVAVWHCFFPRAGLLYFADAVEFLRCVEVSTKK